MADVRVQPQRKGGGFTITIGSNYWGSALYAFGGSSAANGVAQLVTTEEEPAHRAFFTELAQLCGRQVELPPNS